MKRKGILIIGNYPPPHGGVPRHIEYLAPYLVEKGWDVHVLSGGQSGVEKKDGVTIYKYNRVAELCLLINSSIKLKKNIYSKLKSISGDNLGELVRCYLRKTLFGERIIRENNIKVISAYNLHGGAPVGAMLSEIFAIPLVVTNFGEIYSMNNFFRKNLKQVNYICRTAKKLLAMSRHCAQSYKLLGLSPGVEVIPYGTDVNKFSPKNDGLVIRKKFGVSIEDKVILFVGRLIRDMGLHTLLEAIPQIIQVDNKIKIFILGEKGDLLNSALQLSNQYRKNLFVASTVSFEELPLYYAASTIVVAPTQSERACGSLSAIEAMATGKPVIAANVGGIPEIVKDGETGILVPPEEPSALKEAILKLLQDEVAIKKMGMYGRERVENYFDENKTDEKIEQLFTEMIGYK